MRQLTFKTFLKQYLADVSGRKSLSIHKLANLSKKNIRIVDPLILYCLLDNKLNTLSKYLSIEISDLTQENFLDEQFSNYSFQKIYQSYLRKNKINEFDNETKSLIRVNILISMKEKKISNYRIYTDLKVNPGNVNDYLKNGNAKKVSLKLVKDIYNYCQSR